MTAGVSFGTVPLFIRWLTADGVSPWFQLAARVLVSTLLLAAVTLPLIRKQAHFPAGPNLVAWATQGLLMLAAMTTYNLSLALGTPPPKAILLSSLSPLYAALLGTLALGEVLTRRKAGALTIGFAGIIFTLRAWDVEGLTHVEASDLLALANGAIYAAFIVLGRWRGNREVAHPIASTLWVFSFVLAWFVVGALAAFLLGGSDLLRSHLPDTIDGPIVASLVGLALTGTIIPFSLMGLALKRIEAGTASLLLLSEPISVFILSFIFLGEPIGWWQLVGGALILSAGVLVAV